ncbi:hypothetical protein ACIA5D_33250 [Actinoplanes sp. NPDC051513]|uniref:hypothetical protein n=1 Tax=Actinoplanes sp. NPDC051513 TaxID=3363908 RepID=UPI00378CAA31
MTIVLVGRTLIIAGWLLGVWWHGIGEPAGVAVAIALPLVWMASLARDRHAAGAAHRKVNSG